MFSQGEREEVLNITKAANMGMRPQCTNMMKDQV